MKKVVVLGIAALLIFGGLFLKVFASTPSDEAMIQEALTTAAQASGEGKEGSVLEYLSGNLQVMGFTPSKNDIRNYIQKNKPKVKLGAIRPIINGDEAVVNTSAEVRMGVGNLSATQKLDRVTITMRKETKLQMLVFPVPTWRIVKVSAESADLGNPFDP